MAVSLNNETDLSLPAGVLEKMEGIADEALAQHDLPGMVEISLTLCGNAAIHALNQKWRGIDRPTDVLSFPLWDGEEEMCAGEMPLGDIIISVERAQEQAEEFGHSLMRELVYLFTHGLLHLLGYDHNDDGERQAMRSEEEKLLSMAGVERDEF